VSKFVKTVVQIAKIRLQINFSHIFLKKLLGTPMRIKAEWDGMLKKEKAAAV